VLLDCVASRPFIGWRLYPSNSTQITDGCGVGQLFCFRCMQAKTADTVIAYITHDNRPSTSSASTERSDVAVCIVLKCFFCFSILLVCDQQIPYVTTAPRYVSENTASDQNIFSDAGRACSHCSRCLDALVSSTIDRGRGKGWAVLNTGVCTTDWDQLHHVYGGTTLWHSRSVWRVLF